MPIPQPNKNEDSQKFVARCMSNETMKKDYGDMKQRLAVCLGQTSKGSLAQQVHDNILNTYSIWDDEWDEFTWDIEISEVFDEDGKLIAAEKNGRKVTLNKPFRTPDGPKKFSVYVKNDKGNIVKVNFGDPNMKIKKNIPERRKSFRARHNCANPGPKWKARYWACKSW
jgi:hypothetical protein